MARHNRKRRAWTQSELDFLAANWSAMQISELAQKLSRPLISVAKKAADLGLSKYRPWTLSEEAFLRAQYGRKPASEIAQKLGRSTSAVHQRAYELRLRQGATREAVSLRERLGLCKGDRVRILQRCGKAAERVCEGTVLKVYEHHVLVQLPRWKESFNFGQMACGEVIVTRLERRRAA